MSEGPKRLVADIERIPGRFRGRYRGSLTVEGDFWDLSQYKSVIGRIHPDDVIDWPRTVCVAWRFIGRKRVEFASVWDDESDMLDRIWHAVDEADIVIGHNFRGFDMKHLRTEWRDNGMSPPSPVKIVDTLSIARREFGDESKTLDALTKRIGIDSKTDRYSVKVARAAVAGDVKAQRKIKAYNIGDIKASEALYTELLPWTHGHPNMSLYNGGNDQCPCGSYDMTRQGYAYTPAGKYQQYRCSACGSWFRGKHALESVDLRPVAA